MSALLAVSCIATFPRGSLSLVGDLLGRERVPRLIVAGQVVPRPSGGPSVSPYVSGVPGLRFPPCSRQCCNVVILLVGQRAQQPHSSQYDC